MINKARIRQEGLAAQAYWQDDVTPSGAAMVLSGLPYVPDREPITDCLMESRLFVLQPQYAGTYDSDGAFSPESAVASAVSAATLLEKSDSVHDLRGDREVAIPGHLLTLAAHSFGTFVGIGAVLQGIRPDVAIMLSPMFVFGKECAEAGIRVDMERHVRHIRDALPLTFRLESFERWHQFFTSQDTFHIPPERVPGGKRTRVVCVTGEKDPGLDARTAERFVERFCKVYSHAIELVDFLVVKGGMHDSRTLMTEGICRKVAKTIKAWRR